MKNIREREEKRGSDYSVRERDEGKKWGERIRRLRQTGVLTNDILIGLSNLTISNEVLLKIHGSP